MTKWEFKPAADLGLPPLKRLRSERREGGVTSKMIQFCARVVVRLYLKLWHRVEVKGDENLPLDTPLILVSNHTSHLDSIVLASAVPWRIRERLFPLAAGDVFFETPVSTTLSAYVINALPMWRKNVGKHALDALKRRIREEGCGYILFPEGRRSEDGSLLDFKAGIGMMVAGTGIPVVPCWIAGAHKALGRGASWPRPRKVTLIIGTPLTFAESQDNSDGWKEVAARVRAEVERLSNESLNRRKDQNMLNQAQGPGPHAPSNEARQSPESPEGNDN